MFSELRTRKLRRLFQVMDGDGDGSITMADPAHVLDGLAAMGGLEKGSPGYNNFAAGFNFYLQDLIAKADANRDGAVTFEEWIAYHETMLADEAAFASTAGFSASLMFALVDKDHDGKITIEEYGNWLKAWDGDAEMTDDLFHRLDLNGDGTLTEDEVLALTRDFYYSEDPEAAGNWAMGPF